MPVITVSRLTGSGGATIGQRLAEHLGASYLNTQIIREVAHRLGISEATAAEYNERAEAFIERLSRVLWQTGDATIIDGVPNGLAELTVDGSRQAVKIQTGSLAVYAFVMLIGVVFLVAVFLVSR